MAKTWRRAIKKYGSFGGHSKKIDLPPNLKKMDVTQNVVEDA
jgi:hypothetical protein